MQEIKNISKTYKDKTVLDDISYTFEPGKVITIVAPNGTGKTTLLSVLSGLVLPDRGKLLYDTREVGVVLAGEKNLYLKNTVLENLYLFGKLQGMKKQLINERMQCFQKYVPDFDRLKNKLAEELSYGQKRIIAIFSCLITDVKMILLDEVTEGLDMAHVGILKELLKACKKDRAVVLVSHDYDFVTEVSDEIIFLKDGHFERIFESLSLEELKEAYVKAFAEV